VYIHIFSIPRARSLLIRKIVETESNNSQGDSHDHSFTGAVAAVPAAGHHREVLYPIRSLFAAVLLSLELRSVSMAYYHDLSILQNHVATGRHRNQIDRLVDILRIAPIRVLVQSDRTLLALKLILISFFLIFSFLFFLLLLSFFFFSYFDLVSLCLSFPEHDRRYPGENNSANVSEVILMIRSLR
jgi:hypothetical protein